MDAVKTWILARQGKPFSVQEAFDGIPYNRSSVSSTLRRLEQIGVLIHTRGVDYQECPAEFRKPGRKSHRMVMSDALIAAVMGLPVHREDE